LTSEHSTPASSAPGDVFATTHWMVVLSAGKRATPQSDAALEQLCKTCWLPLYACARGVVTAKRTRRNLTQAFFRQWLEPFDLGEISLR
jgi:hypothetical protein